MAAPATDSGPLTARDPASGAPVLRVEGRVRTAGPQGCWAGLDGCRSGWVLAIVTADGRRRSVTVTRVGTITSAFDELRARQASLTGIDMPIGLPDDGNRPADRAARALLGPRRSTVFPTPSRVVLDAVDYPDALARSRAATGVGLSKQAWNLMPKIAELDRVVTPTDEDHLFEVHPELAFLRLAGGVVAEPKKTPAGRARRVSLLQQACGLTDDDAGRLARGLPGAGVAIDDVLVAVAVALSARSLATGTGTVLGDGGRDGRGLVMRICF